MRYITGINGEDFALQGDRSIAFDISRALSAMLLANMASSEVKAVDSKLFCNKISQVVADTHRSELKPILTLTSNCIHDLLLNHVSIGVPVGPCHGDLTLSNIIWSPSVGLVLIDFLSTFLDSPLQDLAKISQDLEFGWTFRRMDQNLLIKSKVFSETVFPSYAGYLYELFPGASFLFKILCLARIAPYVSDSITAEWLNRSLTLAIEQAPSANKF